MPHPFIHKTKTVRKYRKNISDFRIGNVLGGRASKENNYKINHQPTDFIKGLRLLVFDGHYTKKKKKKENQADVMVNAFNSSSQEEEAG